MNPRDILTEGSLASALPRLMHETELQKMLTDEKMRSEKHRTNYETLKTAHARFVATCYKILP